MFFSLPKSLIIEICGRLYAEPKTHKKTHPFKTTQNYKKTESRAPKGSIMMLCWDHLGTHFSSNFLTHPNLLKHCVKTLLYHFRHLILASKIH